MSQANRVLELIDVITHNGAIEQPLRRTASSKCFTNPYAGPDGAPYIFITKKGIVRFGHILSTSSVMPETRINRMIAGGTP